jgi:hypothetical protein
MTLALEDAEKAVEWADGFAEWIGEEPDELMEMGEVVSGPCGEEIG